MHITVVRQIHWGASHASIEALELFRGQKVPQEERDAIEENTKVEDELVVKCQKSVERIVNFLGENTQFDDVYVEGFRVQDGPIDAKALSKFTKNQEAADKMQPCIEARRAETDRLRDKKNQVRLPIRKSFLQKRINAGLYQNAVRVKQAGELELPNKLLQGVSKAVKSVAIDHLLPIEDSSTYDSAIEQVHKVSKHHLMLSWRERQGKGAPTPKEIQTSEVLAEKFLECMEKREDFAIKHIAEREKTDNQKAILLYGGAHDFVDQVVTWNKAHPDSQIALTVITPENYPTTYN